MGGGPGPKEQLQPRFRLLEKQKSLSANLPERQEELVWKLTVVGFLSEDGGYTLFEGAEMLGDPSSPLWGDPQYRYLNLDAITRICARFRTPPPTLTEINLRVVWAFATKGRERREFPLYTSRE